MEHAGVVILDTGDGGAGHDGSILMIGRNTATPYERPPMSMDYLFGQ